MLQRTLVTLFLFGCTTSAPNTSGETAEDAQFLALVDTDDDGSAIEDDAPRQVRLSELAAQQAKQPRLIMLVAAAGWCGPCQAEAAALSSFADDYRERGVLIVTALIEDVQSRPASIEFARLWAREFSLTVPALIDTEFQTSDYVDINAMPTSVVLDADTLSIRTTEVGADTGADPLGKYRALLDHELSSLSANFRVVAA